MTLTPREHRKEDIFDSILLAMLGGLSVFFVLPGFTFQNRALQVHYNELPPLPVLIAAYVLFLTLSYLFLASRRRVTGKGIPSLILCKRQLPPSGVCHPDGGVRISFGMQRPAGPHGRSPAFFVARKKRSERRLTGPSFTPLCSSSRSPSSLRRFPSPPPS